MRLVYRTILLTFLLNYVKYLLLVWISMKFFISHNQDFFQSLDRLLKIKSDVLMQIFIQEGPLALRKKLDITLDKHWQYIFDYLVFSEEVLKKCVIYFMPFFKHLVIEHGPFFLRKTFCIEDSKYDQVFEKIFDMVGIAEGALYDYVLRHKDYFSGQILKGKALDLRKSLALKGRKYDQLWGQIVELLQEAVCQKIYPEQIFEHGFQAFIALMNTLRQQRSLSSYRNMWVYSEEGD